MPKMRKLMSLGKNKSKIYKYFRSIILQFLFQICQMQKSTKSLRYRFVKQHIAQYGYALYLSGQLKNLGSWDPLKAIKMICQNQKYWVCQVQVPVDVPFEFKYFVAPFQLNIDKLKDVTWLGQKNESLEISNIHAEKFSQVNDKLLNIMSFNLRFENKEDKGSYSWNSRRDNCCSVILQNFPDLVGVQQPKKNQIQYLVSKIGAYYSYFGKPRDLNASQNSGIFIRKDKFLVLQHNFIWINQQKTPGKIGFGARLPRYFTYLIVQPLNIHNQLFMAVNTHLDHETPLSRAQGVNFIAEAMQQQYYKYGEKLNDFFLTGDFNTSDSDPIFKQLKFQKIELQSMRCILPKENSDFQETFNGFRPKILNFVNKIIKISDAVIIDHIFIKCNSYKPLRFQVLRIDNMIISDHYPIIGYFEASRGNKI